MHCEAQSETLDDWRQRCESSEARTDTLESLSYTQASSLVVTQDEIAALLVLGTTI